MRRNRDWQMNVVILMVAGIVAVLLSLSTTVIEGMGNLVYNAVNQQQTQREGYAQQYQIWRSEKGE